MASTLVRDVGACRWTLRIDVHGAESLLGRLSVLLGLPRCISGHLKLQGCTSRAGMVLVGLLI
jgi:hypothetical protein